MKCSNAAVPLPLMALNAVLVVLFPSFSVLGCYELTVVHTSDIHCLIARHDWWNGRSRCDDPNCFGGLDAIKAFVDRQRLTQHNVIHLSAGDNLDFRSPFCDSFGGVGLSKLYNMLELDAVALGNHDFDHGLEETVELVAAASNYSILASNVVTEPGSPMHGRIYPYKILLRGGKKIGIIGYVLNLSCWCGKWVTPSLRFKCERISVANAIEELKKQGVDIIIAMGHSGLKHFDITLAQTVPGLDLVVGGHSHSFLHNGELTQPPSDSQETIDGPYPLWVRNRLTGAKVPVVHCYKWGKYACWLKMIFDDHGNIIQAFGEPVLMGDTVARDQQVQSEISKMFNEVGGDGFLSLAYRSMKYEISRWTTGIRYQELRNIYGIIKNQFGIDNSAICSC